MEIQEVVAVSACRTAIAKFMGGLKDVSARELAMTAGRHAIARAGIAPDQIDEICMGQVFPGMQGSLPARQVAMRIGLSNESSAVSINQNCASGMRAIEVAAHSIMLGKTRSALIVGTESMTNAPYLLPKGRMGYRMGPGQIEDQMLHDGLVDELVPGHMGLTAENIAEQYGITREECDALALTSHLRAKAAIEKGTFKEEIVPVEIASRKKTLIFDTDEHPILDASGESMAKLPSAFKKGGVVTAANASGLNDGAAAMVLMSKKAALDLGLKPLMKLVNICDMGVDPKVMGLGPAVCIPKCLKQAGLSFDAIDYWEINEAFAAQWLGVGRMLETDFGMKLDMEKVNANGSGIALGHPVGCTGLRIVVSLYHEMKRRGARLGGASLCVGGGPAVSSLWTLDI
ncbi:acetyl-CoA C-acyltransferase [Desulfobotulus sp.]|jgi:acetyl-CoA C-acetyltransferase|uniref:thiolase family protein n=1 Tax=Desulfobotulus sp. TaxID=1940337 RepID=UPI002A369566|nr:acetyl-CoA C-acyltransferase [Desulfobotulus sp.]MDY0163998.1 acetyl-CoA C-acyltransferase [Desulfobotulus sp.]